RLAVARRGELVFDLEVRARDTRRGVVLAECGLSTPRAGVGEVDRYNPDTFALPAYAAEHRRRLRALLAPALGLALEELEVDVTRRDRLVAGVEQPDGKAIATPGQFRTGLQCHQVSASGFRLDQWVSDGWRRGRSGCAALASHHETHGRTAEQ